MKGFQVECVVSIVVFSFFLPWVFFVVLLLVWFCCFFFFASTYQLSIFRNYNDACKCDNAVTENHVKIALKGTSKRHLGHLSTFLRQQ